MLLYVCYARYIRKDSVIKIGGYGFLIVMTGSMEPTIEKNEFILIKECQTYHTNDVATYLDVYGNLITHRILQIDEQNFITKGDSNEISDESTNIHNIQGKVIFHSKILGIFYLYYLKGIVCIYIAILVALYLKEEFRKEKNNEKEKEEK